MSTESTTPHAADTARPSTGYTPPALVELGRVDDLTLSRAPHCRIFWPHGHHGRPFCRFQHHHITASS